MPITDNGNYLISGERSRFRKKLMIIKRIAVTIEVEKTDDGQAVVKTYIDGKFSASYMPLPVEDAKQLARVIANGDDARAFIRSCTQEAPEPVAY